MDIGHRIKERRKSLNMSATDLGKRVGKDRSTIYRYENGEIENLSIDFLEPLAAALDTTPAYLMGWEETKSEPSLRPLNTPLSGGQSIPVLGKVPAGIPIEAVEDIIDEIELTQKMTDDPHDYFALLVSGNSMYPEYLDGDIVIVRKQDTAETGDDVIAYVNGYDATLKRLVRSSKGITLRPLNSEFEPRTYTNEDMKSIPIRIAGVVVEQRRNRK